MKDIKITPTMLAAGIWAYKQFAGELTEDVVVREIFNAMVRAPKQPRPTEYAGYLAPYVSRILELADAGKYVKEIVTTLDQEGVFHGHTLTSGVRHVLNRYGRKPKNTRLADYSFRNFEIVALRKRGLTLKEIGKKFGISGEAVRYVIMKHKRKQQRLKQWPYK